LKQIVIFPIGVSVIDLIVYDYFIVFMFQYMSLYGCLPMRPCYFTQDLLKK